MNTISTLKELKYIGFLLLICLTLVQSACKDKPSDVVIYGGSEGHYLPDFNLPDTSDSVVSLSDFEGKNVLIVFWASWCSYCTAEIDDLKQISNNYSDKNLEVIGISLDKDKNVWMAKIVNHNIQYTQLIDTDAFDAEIAKACQVTTIPKLILADPSGEILRVSNVATSISSYLDKNFN